MSRVVRKWAEQNRTFPTRSFIAPNNEREIRRTIPEFDGKQARSDLHRSKIEQVFTGRLRHSGMVRDVEVPECRALGTYLLCSASQPMRPSPLRTPFLVALAGVLLSGCAAAHYDRPEPKRHGSIKDTYPATATSLKVPVKKLSASRPRAIAASVERRPQSTPAAERHRRVSTRRFACRARRPWFSCRGLPNPLFRRPSGCKPNRKRQAQRLRHAHQPNRRQHPPFQRPRPPQYNRAHLSHPQRRHKLCCSPCLRRQRRHRLSRPKRPTPHLRPHQLRRRKSPSRRHPNSSASSSPARQRISGTPTSTTPARL
jgi:hypothetical protein